MSMRKDSRPLRSIPMTSGTWARPVAAGNPAGSDGCVGHDPGYNLLRVGEKVIHGMTSNASRDGAPMVRDVLWHGGRPPVSLATPASAVPGRVDAAVVGAGLTGLSAALTLAEAGLSVAVFEAGTAGDGASGRNGGQVLTGVNPLFQDLIRLEDEERARARYRAGDRAVDEVAELVARLEIRCDFHRGGHLAVALDRVRLQALERDARLLASPAQMLDRREVEARIGFGGYLGGLFDPRSATANPYALTLGIGRAAVLAGVHIVEHARVEIKSASGHQVIAGAGRPVRADRILLATNGFLPESIPSLRLRMRRVYGTVVATAPLDADLQLRVLPGRPAVFEESDRYTHFQRTGDGRLVFGGRAEGGPDGPEGVARLLKTLMADLPHKGVEVPTYWTGPLGITGSGLPAWGETPAGVIWVGGYSGHGVALSVLMGIALGRYLAFSELPQWPRGLSPAVGFSDRTPRSFRPSAGRPARYAFLR